MKWKKLSQDIWKKYGFMGNPFDITPLSQDKNSLLPVSKAIVGRGFNTKESKLLTNVLRIPGGGRIMVTGNIGVGKTTFINYHRYIWENHAQDKLFTTYKEIVVTEEWRLRHFLINIICSIMDKLLQVEGEEKITKVTVFKNLLAFSRIFYHTNLSIQGSIFGFGGGFSKTEQPHIPPVIPEIQLLQYVYEAVLEIKKIGYSGIFLHIDNLELFSNNKQQKAKIFFEEIRDCIQTPDIYFVFVARKGFFQEVISPSERVRSVFFGRPIVIPPLSKKQVLSAIHKRYELLTIKSKNVIYPVEESFIEYLYDLYSGKLRYIMDAMNMILPEFDTSKAKTIPIEKAINCLSCLLKEHVRNNLTPTEWKIFSYCLKLDSFTNTILQKKYNMSGPNVTRVIKRFLDLDFVYLHKKEGRNLFYKINDYTKIIDYSLDKKVFEKNQSKINYRLEKAKELVKEKQKITHKEYVDLLFISTATATRDLKKLVEQGFLCIKGNNRNRYYEIVSQ